MQKLPRYVDIDQIVALVGQAQAFKTAAAKTTPIEQKRFLNDGLFLNKWPSIKIKECELFPTDKANILEKLFG